MSEPTEGQTPATTVSSPYLTAPEAAAYCRVAIQTLYNSRKFIRRVPGVGKLLFTRAALDEWLATPPHKRKKAPN